MANPEQRYCRTPLARAFNKAPNTCWHGVRNAGDGLYDSGMPDAFVTEGETGFDSGDHGLTGQFVALLSCLTGSYKRYKAKCFTIVKQLYAIECKAFFGSVYLGNPDDPDDHTGWHASQRNWYQTVAIPEGIDYRIALWVYSSRNPKPPIQQTQARLFLVPPPAWLALEAKGERTVSLTANLERIHAKKHLNIVDWFGTYEVTLKNVADYLCNTKSSAMTKCSPVKL